MYGCVKFQLHGKSEYREGYLIVQLPAQNRLYSYTILGEERKQYLWRDCVTKDLVLHNKLNPTDQY